MIDFLKFQIDKVCDNKKEKDFIAFLVIVFLAIILFAGLSFITNITTDFIKFLYLPFKQKGTLVEINKLNYFILIMWEAIIKYLKQILIWPIITVIAYIYLMKFGIYSYKKFRNYWLIFIVFNTILFFKKELSILFFFLILILINFPLGSGKFYEFFLYFRYMNEIIQKERNLLKKKKDSIINKLLFSLVICVIMSLLTTRFFKLNFLLIFICYLSMTMNIFSDKSEDNEILESCKLLVINVFVLIIYIVLSPNQHFIIKEVVLFLITMYFSWGRIFSISKDFKEIIKKKSVLYYYEGENINLDELNKTYIEYKLIDQNIKEDELVIQIMVRYNLFHHKCLNKEGSYQLRQELFDLCNLYFINEYTSSSILIRYINVCFNKEKFQDDKYKEELDKVFEEIEKKDKQNVVPREAIIDYIIAKYYYNEFDKVKKVYFEYVYIYARTLDIQIIKILRDTFNELEEEDMVSAFDNIIEKLN